MKPFPHYATQTLLAALSYCISSPLMALENPQQVDATALLGSLSDGPNYRITSSVQSDGLFRIFVFDTSYGQYQTKGTGYAKVFIQELRSLNALEKMSKSDVFTKSLTNAATAPIKYGADLIINPIGTIRRSASGVSNMVDRVSAGLSNQDGSRSSTTDSLLGVDDARRQIAVGLGIDPYTQFPPLSEKLTEIANAAALGGISVKVALAAIPGGVGTVISTAGSADSAGNTLRDKTSAQISQDVKGSLARLGVSGSTISLFIQNRSYSPADLLAISRALGRLRAGNTQIFIERAAAATNRATANFQRQRAEFLAERSSQLGGISSFVSVGGFPLNRTQDGNIIAAFPFDDISWTGVTERTATAVTSEIKRTHALAQKPIFATSKGLSATASAELKKLGWQIVQLK